jgi:anti-sigma factor RsiW
MAVQVPYSQHRELVDAFFDGELVGEEHERMAAHLGSCALCKAALEDLQSLSGQLAKTLPEVAPPGLAGRIRADIAAAAEGQAGPVMRAWLSEWTAKVAAVAAACLLTAALTWGVLTRIDATAQLERDALSAHLRSLMQDSLVQIASSDRHVVKPWFAGRVDFAPTVSDLAAQGFPLIGARLDYVGDRRVGTLVYKRRNHFVSIFMWAATAGESDTPAAGISSHSRNGHNMLTWTKDRVQYWAISDLNREELEELQRLL